MCQLRHLPTITLLATLSLAAWGLERVHDASLQDRLLLAAPEAVSTDAVLGPYARHQGRAAYAKHCAGCHGTDGDGDSGRGVPALASGHWLYGTGSVSELEHTILYGIRSGHPKSRNLASMPAYASAKPYAAYAIPPLTPAQLDEVTAYLLKLRGLAVDSATARRGSTVYHGSSGCYDCHSDDAKGDPAIGAPDLTAAKRLLGDGSPASIRATIAHGLADRCPAWIGRLPPATIRALAVYVQALPTHHDD
jgi:cytochrome c oxidase cbb3-type subunit 3